MNTKIVLLASMIAVVGFTGLSSASHDEGCVPEQADPASVNMVGSFYVEERGNPLGVPVPGSGFVLGGGTWIYEETNGVDGLQRGGSGPLGIDTTVDASCGHGPDALYF